MQSGTVLQSVLDAAGPQAWQIERLWWLMFWTTSAVFVVVMAFVIAPVFRRRRHQDAPDHPLLNITREWRYQRMVALAIAATVVTLFVLLTASVWTGRAIASPGPTAAVVINITGRQWWWEAEYEDATPSRWVRTANEFHVPVGRPVVLKLTSRDVIHSFWVPNLHGKRDLIPGYTTSQWLQADRPGTFRGQCAEFCGFQHANMGLYIVAEPEADYQQWLANQRRSAAEPLEDQARRGRELFLASTCTQCHAIRGTIAGATLGPDLTHVASRSTIAAGRLSNTPEHVAEWVRDPQRVKPGNRMPAHAMAADDLQALVTYLGSLK